MPRLRGRERRLHPRVDESLPVKITVNGYDFSTTTQNISCVGAYCCVNKYVPPFTKLALKITLPGAESAAPDHPIGPGASKKMSYIECKGVIVRSEDEATGGFNIAIFFNEIAEAARQRISQYVSRSLSCAPARN